MSYETRNDGKLLTGLLSFIGMLTVIVVSVTIWFTWDANRTTVTKFREAVEKVQPVVKEVLDKSVPVVNEVLVKVREGTTEVLTARERYKEALDKFEVQKEKYSQKLEEGKNSLLTFKGAMETAQDKSTEFAKVYTTWESVESEVAQIQEKFAALVSGADNLYIELEDRAKCITGEHLPDITLAKIAKSRKRYTLKLQECEVGIDKLSAANNLVQNTMIALEISYALEVLEATIDQTLREINTMVDTVMAQLEELTQESRQLLEIRITEVLTEG